MQPPLTLKGVEVDQEAALVEGAGVEVRGLETTEVIVTAVIVGDEEATPLAGPYQHQSQTTQTTPTKLLGLPAEAGVVEQPGEHPMVKEGEQYL